MTPWRQQEGQVKNILNSAPVNEESGHIVGEEHRTF